MNEYLRIMETRSEGGEVVTLILMGKEQAPISYEELADALREYADLIELNEEIPN
jgi:hypothetical protein